MYDFIADDLKLFEESSLSVAEIRRQLQIFSQGYKFTDLEAAATIGNGIINFSEEDNSYYLEFFKTHINEFSLTKFVPASGAASRMFKTLTFFFKNFSEKELNDKQLLINKSSIEEVNTLYQFWKNIDKFPFYNDLIKLNNNSTPKTLYQTLKLLLDKNKLNYASLPKAFLKFHKYKSKKNTTPIDEHVYEAKNILPKNSQEKYNIHLTLSPEFLNDKYLHEYLNKYPEIDFSFSSQHSKTNTIAVDVNNQPFRNQSGEIILRPGGHGSLLYNLEKIKDSNVIIKNIDNICHQDKVDLSINSQKLLIAFFMEQKIKIDKYLRKINNNNLSTDSLRECKNFIEIILHKKLPDQPTLKYLSTILDRPFRVCAVVKNTGEPGGGPFWTWNKEKELSLQIVESPQINYKDNKQKEISKTATHFNPVNIVCSLANYEGTRYKLNKYLDPDTAFISEKSLEGKILKALEHPGLWNGSMAYWNTVFIELPPSSFTPVKEVNDLLKQYHTSN